MIWIASFLDRNGCVALSFASCATRSWKESCQNKHRKSCVSTWLLSQDQSQDSRIWFLNIFVLCDWNQTLLTFATKSPTVSVALAWAESLLHVSTNLSCPATLLHGHDPALSVLLCGIKRGACKGTPTHNISKLSLYPSFGVRNVSNLEPCT